MEGLEAADEEGGCHVSEKSESRSEKWSEKWDSEKKWCTAAFMVALLMWRCNVLDIFRGMGMLTTLVCKIVLLWTIHQKA